MGPPVPQVSQYTDKWIYLNRYEAAGVQGYFINVTIANSGGSRGQPDPGEGSWPHKYMVEYRTEEMTHSGKTCTRQRG